MNTVPGDQPWTVQPRGTDRDQEPGPANVLAPHTAERPPPAAVPAAGKYELVNPATGQVLATVGRADAEDVAGAVEAARRVFDSGVWSDLSPRGRGRVLLRVADLLRDRAGEFAELESRDVGKPVMFSRSVDVPAVIETFEYYGSLAAGLEGAARPTTVPALAYSPCRPAGSPFPPPGILGHEGAGIITAVGPGVTRVAPGDKVLLSFSSCGRCGTCRAGHPAYCATWLPRNLLAGAREDGSPTVHRDGQGIGGRFFGQSSFAEYALADERSMVRIGQDAPLDLLAPLGCGVQTGFGTVWNILRPAPGSTLVVYAVGLAAIMAAAMLPLTAVIAVDRVPARLELAAELGATHTLDTSTGVLDLAGPVHAAIDTTGNPRVLRTAVDSLTTRGTCAVVY